MVCVCLWCVYVYDLFVYDMFVYGVFDYGVNDSGVNIYGVCLSLVKICLWFGYVMSMVHGVFVYVEVCL